jgi:poly(3-hydroxybutyrate) depolymerase
MFRKNLVLGLCLLATSALANTADKLPRLGAARDQTSVSGLSSGAFMAVQLQVAYSRSIIGAGVVAGGPYYCAANHLMLAGICMGQVPFTPPNPLIMAQAAQLFASNRQIDSLRNLKTRRVYVFSGRDDTVVKPPAVDATVAFFQQVGVTGERLKYVNTLPAGHALISPGQGNDCAANAAPFISHCTVGDAPYDQAGELLAHIYGPLQPKAPKAQGELMAFNQREFAAQASGLADEAYLYVPPACRASDAHCKVHVAIHGCEQSSEVVGQRFVTETGYNEWADTNGLLVLYPQISKSVSNSSGCWDWWGYSGSDYAKRSGPQMKAIRAMIQRLQKHP